MHTYAAALIPQARPIHPDVAASANSFEDSLVDASIRFQRDSVVQRPVTDRLAVASALCSLLAFIPVLTQIVGLVCGLLSLRRIRRARRSDHPLRGAKWAWTGIITNGGTLAGWFAMFAALQFLGTTLGGTTRALRIALPPVHSSVR